MIEYECQRPDIGGLVEENIQQQTKLYVLHKELVERLQLIVDGILTNRKGKIANLKRVPASMIRQHADKINAIVDHIKTLSLEETKLLI